MYLGGDLDKSAYASQLCICHISCVAYDCWNWSALTAVMHLFSQVAGIDNRWSSKPAPDKLALCMTDVYSSLQLALPPTLHPHYLLTPRHLSLWVLGLQRYTLQGSDLLQASSLLLRCSIHALL